MAIGYLAVVRNLPLRPKAGNATAKPVIFALAGLMGSDKGKKIKGIPFFDKFH